MKKIEVYDSYPNIYSDNVDGELKAIYLKHREILDETRYTLVYPGSGVTEVYESNLDDTSAFSFVNTLYEESKNLGISYEDKLIRLEDGYAELVIKLEDGRLIHRVIFTKDV